MRVRPAVAFFALFLAASFGEASAMRLTDMSGREVFIRQPPSNSRALALKPAGRAVHAAAATVTAGPDVDAANNDYRRIQNALNAAANGDTIILSGTFNFTAPFAAAAWALGNDGTNATADDYEVLVPPGRTGVTFTATALGNATIQGPGDLPAVNLESFLVFDGGPNPGWTISNLRILDFDLAIGMFATNVTDFNNTVIQNNFIRIPTDLNATVAPADVNQNIGVHFSFGSNQSILNNTFNIPGTGVSDSGAGKFSSSVVMQSNTSGGNVYNGLSVSGNVVHILNAQSADPEVVLGIWENAHGHTSNITVSNNSFINDAAGNNPALNVQRAFRVTSHSGATSTVTYSGNSAAGANIGFQWITGSNFAGNQAIVVTGNTLSSCATGALVQSNGIAHFNQNSITGSGAGGGIHVITGSLTASGANTNGAFRNFVSGGSGDGIWIEATAGSVAPVSQNNLSGNAGFGLRNEAVPSILAEMNWWGSNLAANVAAKVSGNADFDPWLASATDVSPATAGFQPFTYATTSGALTTLLGTGAADTGSMLAGSPVTMTMDGDTATVVLAELLSVSIQLGGSDDLFTLGQTGVPTTFDGGAGNDTLIGTNVAQTWNITGAGSGNIPGAAGSFTSVEALRGGTAADSFVFGAAGSVAQTVDGNLGTDSLDNSAIPAHTVNVTGPGTLDGFKGTATGIGGTFDNVNLIANTPADLSVSKSGPATATAATVISYTITVNNLGPNPAVGAQLSDPLPAGTTFSSLASPAGWSCTTPAVNSGGTVTCNRASFPVGSSIFTLNVNAPAAPAAISNTATVSASGTTDPTPGNNSSTANTTVVFTADVAVVKTATATAPAGTNVTYGITVTNNGPSQATSVSLADVLPPNTTFVSQSQPTGPLFNCANPAPGANGTVTCTIASLANGATATFSIVVAVSPAAPTGALPNTATVSTTATDPVPGNNSSTASTTITPASADVAITKTAGPPPYGTGLQLPYTITVNNAGPGPATGVTVTDVLPPGSTFVSATPSQGSCNGTTTVTCNLGTLANGASASITLTVTMPAAAGPLSNTATVSSSNPDPNPANNSSTATVTVIPALSIPALSRLMLLLLALALGMAGIFAAKLRG